ncbi:MAG: PASTA domain protein [Candidatus Methanoperedenaceae archaeon GB37]|nr:PASTA domain protein [Candidatus Methanoperedenaceae archaeon GB37]CAD7783205.1 MAG: PASTA domain protein [Candidatus Methanoperedenaceae archaeon GB37]
MGYGGIVAAPVFKEIAEHLIWQWQIPPSSPTMRMVENTTLPSTNLKTTQNITPPVVTDGIMPDLRGLPLRLAFKILQDANIKVKIKGTGKVVKQIPPPGSKIKNNVCLLQLEAN